jgi:hypothetical protein
MSMGALPMGARLRLKARRDLSGFPPGVQKIFCAIMPLAAPTDQRVLSP